MIDDADDVKPVGDDEGPRKVMADQGAIVGGQVHAHDAHCGFPFQALEIGLQRELRAAQHHVVDLVIFQIAEGGGEPFAAGEEVLVNP